MAENADETIDSTNDTTGEVEKTEEVEETDDQSETEDQGADLASLQEKNKKLFERAKKAEAEAKLLKAERLKKEEQAKVKVGLKPSEKQDGLTAMDAITLSKANIHDDDVEEVVRWAKYNTIGIKEALKDKTMQTILRDRAEQRTTAEATSTGNARRSTSKTSPDQLLEQASKGKLPDDPSDLVEARFTKLKK